jgi:hypothetical protein
MGIEKLDNVGRNQRRRDYFSHLVLDWWIVLTWILKKRDVKVWTGVHRNGVHW